MDGVEIYSGLYEALQSDNWNAVKEFMKCHPQAISAKITDDGRTALHVAVAAGHELIVRELVKQMSKENLEIKDNLGLTALALAARSGNYRMAECMLEKNENLVCIGCNIGVVPVVDALYNGHLKLARYLYLLTPLEILKPENGPGPVVTQAIYSKALGKN